MFGSTLRTAVSLRTGGEKTVSPFSQYSRDKAINAIEQAKYFSAETFISRRLSQLTVFTGYLSMRNWLRIVMGLVFFVSLTSVVEAQADEPLFDFEVAFDLGSVSASNAQVAVTKGATGQTLAACWVTTTAGPTFGWRPRDGASPATGALPWISATMDRSESESWGASALVAERRPPRVSSYVVALGVGHCQGCAGPTGREGFSKDRPETHHRRAGR